MATDLRRTALATVLTLALAAPGGGDVIDRLMAVVGGQLITLSDVRAGIALGLADPGPAPDPLSVPLQTLIERRLVLIEVDRYGLPEPDAAVVDARLGDLRARLGDDPDEALGRLALTPERLRLVARDSARVDAYLGQRFAAVQPTDAEVEQYYRQRAGEFTRGGVQLSFDEVRDLARSRLAAERRDELIDGWVADLRRRTEVNVVYLPGPARER